MRGLGGARWAVRLMNGMAMEDCERRGSVCFSVEGSCAHRNTQRDRKGEQGQEERKGNARGTQGEVNASKTHEGNARGERTRGNARGERIRFVPYRKSVRFEEPDGGRLSVKQGSVTSSSAS
eukprot:6057261-Pleurochrysis_carterae.AAC.1